MKKIIIICIIFIFSFSVCCDVKDGSNTEDDGNKENVAFTYKYKEMSDISILSSNSIIKYTTEHTNAELYKWNDEISLPIPCPGEIVQEESRDKMLMFSGVSEKTWNDYVEQLKGMFSHVEVIEVVEHYDGWRSGGVKINDEKIGLSVNLNWTNNLANYNVQSNDRDIENVLMLWCYMANQENYNMDTQLIKSKIKEKLNISSMDDYVLFDVTSRSNYEKGYFVYYLRLPELVKVGEITQYMYICVVKNKEIVLLEPNVVSLGYHNNEIEFITENASDIMYVLSYHSDKDASMSNSGKQIIDKYLFSNAGFIYEKRMLVKDLIGCDDKIVTFERENDDIYLYELLEKDGYSNCYNEMYTIGEKIVELR